MASSSSSEHERSQIYREHLDELRGLRENETVNPDICIQKMNRLLGQMENMDREERYSSSVLCLDLQVTNVAGKVIKEHCLESAQTRQAFNDQEFIDVLTGSFMKDDGLDLSAVGIFGRAMLKPCPGYLSLMGHLSVEAKELPQKERRVREARKKEKLEEAKKPNKLTEAPQKTELGIDEIITKVGKVLKRKYTENNSRPLCYFTFVLHPTEFAKTVQNMFHISFLIKDGLARMSVDSEGLPTIEPTNRDEKKGDLSSLPKKQMISSLSVKEYKELVRIFEIREAVL